MYYIKMPQEVTNENAITLVYYLAQQKTGKLALLQFSYLHYLDY